MENDVLKIADFGVSQSFRKKKDDLTNKKIGTTALHPPEIIKSNFILPLTTLQTNNSTPSLAIYGLPGALFTTWSPAITHSAGEQKKFYRKKFVIGKNIFC